MFDSNKENIENKRVKIKILSLGPYEFETYIADLFIKLGYLFKRSFKSSIFFNFSSKVIFAPKYF